MIIRTAGIALAATLLASCTTIEVVKPPEVAELVGTEPAIGVTAKSSVGGTIYSQFRYWAHSSHRLSSDISTRVAGAPVVVTPGDVLFEAIADGKRAMCTERLTMMNFVGVPIKRTCFVDTQSRGMFDVVMVPADAMWHRRDLSPPVPYALRQEVIPRPDAVKRELIFQGTSRGTLRLGYREYMNDMARPAYFQDATYDLDALPTTVTYRAARIEVLSVSNEGLTYRVLSGF